MRARRWTIGGVAVLVGTAALASSEGGRGPRLPSDREVWLRGESPSFIFYTNGSATRAKEVARELESLHAVLSRVGTAASRPAAYMSSAE